MAKNSGREMPPVQRDEKVSFVLYFGARDSEINANIKILLCIPFLSAYFSTTITLLLHLPLSITLEPNDFDEREGGRGGFEAEPSL